MDNRERQMLFTQRQGRVRAYIQHLVKRHTNAVAQLPRWRHPIVGYLVGLLLVGFGLAVGVVETHLLLPFSFPSVPLLFAIVLVALLWGAGPAIFVVLLSLLVLDYWYVPPFGTLGAYGWSGMLQLLTFASACIVIALLANQREVARVRAMVGEREAVLRANQLEATFEAMNDGVVIHDKQGQVLHANAATRRLLGLDALPSYDEGRLRQELLLKAVQRGEQGRLLPEKRRPLSRLFAGEILTGTQATDVFVQTPNGRQLVLNMSGSPIRSEAGTIERAVVIYRDVTERRRFEQSTAEALRALLTLAELLIHFPERPRQDEKTTSLSDTAFVGQRVVELTRSVVESIHVVMLAVEPEEEIVRPIASVGLTPQEEQQWQERLMVSPLLSHHIGSHSLLSHLKDGEVLILEGMTLPFYTAVLPYYVRTVLVAPICVEKRLAGVLCVDDGSRGHTYTPHEMTLTQTIAGLAALILTRAQLLREPAEARANAFVLREAHLRLEEFLSIICHELKTPLTVMHGSLQLAECKVKRLVSSEALPPDEMQRFAPILALLERARNQIGIQDRLVNDLLDASRVQAHTLQLLVKPCNLTSIIQQAVDDQRQISPARTIYLETPAGENVPIYGDADRLMQVVTNYLTNALKYSSADRPVEVRLRVEGQTAQVSVRDEGPGLPATEHERIWERFYRVPGLEVHSGSGGGLGVGLFVCRTIIERHGGQVGVESRPGEGSTFWFTLPLATLRSRDEANML
jgi:signal transduction histidine kinase/PAS domain-containing protein